MMGGTKRRMRRAPAKAVAYGVVLIGGMLAASSAAAQSPAQCDSAAAAMLGRRLPPAHSDEWQTWDRATACGGPGLISKIVNEMRVPAVRSETDGERVRWFFGRFNGLREGALFDAYAAASTDASASDAWRIGALWALAGTLTDATANHMFGYREVRLPPDGASPSVCSTTDRGLMEMSKYNLERPSTIPPDALERAIALTHRIAATEGTSRVGVAARCWEGFLKREAPVDRNRITVSNVCGYRFLIRNANHADVALRYSVGTDKGELTVDGEGTYTLQVDEDGPLRVAFATVETQPEGAVPGVVVAVTANRGVACP